MSDLIPLTAWAARQPIGLPRIRVLARAGRLAGAVKLGRDWLIPAEAVLPPRVPGWPLGRKRSQTSPTTAPSGPTSE